MGRLTKRNEDGKAYIRALDDLAERAVINKLAHYEDMEEQGCRMVNIDKVVEQLEECKCNDGLPADIVWNNAVKICIEIVKKGGTV